MIPVWAMVLLVVFVPGIIKMMLDSMSGGQRGGFKSLNLKSMANVNMLVGLLTVFVILWVLVYVIPGLFHSIFNTTLGNIILLLAVALSFIKNISTGIAVLVGLLLFKSLASSAHIEGFTEGVRNNGGVDTSGLRKDQLEKAYHVASGNLSKSKSEYDGLMRNKNSTMQQKDRALKEYEDYKKKEEAAYQKLVNAGFRQPR